MLFAQTVSPDGWIAIVIAVLSGIISYIASELTRRYAWGKRDGEMDVKAQNLAASLAEFKTTINDAFKEMKEAAEKHRLEIKADFIRVYDLMAKSHGCLNEREIGELRNQVRVNTGRLDELERWRHEQEKGANED